MLQSIKADYLREQTINNSLTSCWPLVIIMMCAILELDLKNEWYTWIVGHLLNQKIEKGRENPWKIQRCHFSLIAVWNAQSGALRRLINSACLREERIAKSNFLPNFIQVLWFFSIFCSCVISHCLSVRRNNPHMFHFKLFALFWYCNTSNRAHRTRGGGRRHPGEWYSKTPCSPRKRSTHKFCVALLSRAHFALRERDGEVWKQETHIFLHPLRRTIS